MAPAPYTTLVAATDLLGLLASDAPPVVLDCGFDLADPAAAERAYAAGHLPGARYAHLDRELSGTKSGHNGRHPLPERGAFARRAGAWGITSQVQVVAYDAQGGPYAARAWWLLRWLGHQAVAVLDGGPAAFVAAGGTLSTELPSIVAKPPYPEGGGAMPTVEAAQILAAVARHEGPDRADELLIVDARAPERFRGEVEPLDPVAGRIPGAINRFFKDNLGTDGRFKPAAQLREEFARLGLAARTAAVVQQCGSGVTACHNLLAMAHAGLGDTALYPGSWSEWCADPSRPVARG